MSHPGAADADGARSIEICSATWERIQITLRMRPVDGRLLDPATIVLIGPAAAGRRRGPDDTRRARVGPARAVAEDDVVAARFNVMQGPDQVPLSPGRWVVGTAALPGTDRRRPPAVPVRVTAATAGALKEPTAEFHISRGRYAVAAEVGPDGSLALVVELGPAAPLTTPAAAATEATASATTPTAAVTGSAAAAPAVPPPAPSFEDEYEPPVKTLLARLGRSIRQLRPAGFRVAFRAFRAVSRRNGRRILFTSDSHAELGGNMKIVVDRMVERGLDREYELLFLFKESITVRRGFRDRLRLPWLLARADVIVIDDYQPAIYRVDDPDTRIVQLWHAWGAFKTVGYSRVGKPGGLNPYGRVHKVYTHAIVSSETEVPFYAEAFGIPESRVVPTGIPRMDQFWDPDRAAASREAALEAYPAARGRTVFLFAPTFRGHGAKTATYDVSQLDYAALHALCVERDAVCIIRMHPFVRTPLDIPAAYADRVIDGSTSTIDINDVLFATDLLITDYSSVVYEFSTRDKPMLFFAYDLEEYVASRDFYVRYEDFVPGRIVRTFAGLLDAIRREDYQKERLAAFRATHLAHFDGRATDRVIDLILGR